jgi:hypothetical protein
MLDDDLARVWPGRKPDEVRRNETLDELVGEGHYRFVINGHMHFRMLIDFEQLTLMNAGTVSGTYAGVSMVDFQSGEISVYGVSDDAPPARQLAVELDPGCSRPVWRTTCDFDGSRDPVTLYPR